MIIFLKKHWRILFFIFCGVALRFGVSLVGSNYDLESYHIVGKLVAQGKNVYAETYRYNYGPAWALLLGLFRMGANLLPNPNLIFRLFIIAILSLSDVSLFFWLKKNISQKAAYWFFFNPISIYISGYHNQFDTIAIALALYSTLFLFQKKKHSLIGVLLLGLSIIVKHSAIFYPLWLMFSAKKNSQRILFLIPFVLFTLSFVPFLFTPSAAAGIWANVITYKKSLSLYSFFPTGILRPLLMVIPLLIGGYFYRKEKPAKQILYYLLILVAITPITAGQYFAIPLVAFAGLSMVTGSLFTFLAVWGLYMANQNLIVISQFAFVLCWIPLLVARFSQWKKYVNRVLFGLTLVIFLLIAFQCIVSTIQFVESQKQEFFILKVMQPASSIFPTERGNSPHHIVNGRTVEGSIQALTNNLGFITVPYFLENPSNDFFKKGYKITLSAREMNSETTLYSETRNIEGGLTQDGIILGLPLIANSKGKIFRVRVSSTIPERADYITVDSFGSVQSRYFLTKSEILNPRFISAFIWHKAKYILSLQSTRELIFFYICFIWAILQLTFERVSRS